MNRKKLLILIVLIAIAATLTFVEYVLLPEQVIIQISMSGETNRVVSKNLALVIPLAISLAGSLAYFVGDDNKKYLTITIVGYVASILTLLMN